jgi:hypothetical protein
VPLFEPHARVELDPEQEVELQRELSRQYHVLIVIPAMAWISGIWFERVLRLR